MLIDGISLDGNLLLGNTPGELALGKARATDGRLPQVHVLTLCRRGAVSRRWTRRDFVEGKSQPVNVYRHVKQTDDDQIIETAVDQ